ncbi:MAG: YlbF family regulator [Angelakisella sp.]|nr:YlbF family regulator [Angelakisella sp.]
MDIIEMARELGAALQKSDEYTAYNVAKNAADSDAELQGMIGDFNLKKLSLNAEVQKEEKDPAKLAALNEEVRSIYARIMAHPTMMAYNTTKEELDRILNFIQQIIVYSANGEDPATIQEEASCGGDCSGCSGCH